MIDLAIKMLSWNEEFSQKWTQTNVKLIVKLTSGTWSVGVDPVKCDEFIHVAADSFFQFVVS